MLCFADVVQGSSGIVSKCRQVEKALYRSQGVQNFVREHSSHPPDQREPFAFFKCLLAQDALRNIGKEDRDPRTSAGSKPEGVNIK